MGHDRHGAEPECVDALEFVARVLARISRCLAKKPEDRPSDGAVLAEALERLDLRGWTMDDARAWWRELPKKRASAIEASPTPTQLTVRVDGRRP